MNSAARLVEKVKKFDDISPILFNLHWLPVTARIQFKIILLTFKAMHGLAPQYIIDMVKKYKPKRSGLRSETSNELDRTSPNLITYGQRSFSFASQSLWNGLPPHMRHIEDIEQFKTVLKTHLFKQSFNL